MMTHVVDTSNRKCLILGQTNKMLNNEIEKLLRKVKINQNDSNAYNAEMLRMQTKNCANALKINDYLNQMGILKKKLEEGQSNATEMEPSQVLNLNTYAQELPKDLHDKERIVTSTKCG